MCQRETPYECVCVRARTRTHTCMCMLECETVCLCVDVNMSIRVCLLSEDCVCLCWELCVGVYECTLVKGAPCAQEIMGNGPVTIPGWKVGGGPCSQMGLRGEGFWTPALIRKHSDLLCIGARKQASPAPRPPASPGPRGGGLNTRRFGGHCMSPQIQVLTAAASWLISLGKGVNPVSEGPGIQRGGPHPTQGLWIKEGPGMPR